MRATINHRPKLIQDPERCSTILQDFELLFGAETSSKLLEKWGTHLKAKSAEKSPDEDKVPGWDSDMASLLLLVYLLPPVERRELSKSKSGSCGAMIGVKSCCSLQGHSGLDQRRQPYILAVGTTRNSIHEYYIAIDNVLPPCKTRSSLSAFDEMFKAHCVWP
ncbi:hypothetical protein FQN60_011123 [Etheostoma spectabile]|uniref:Uncharacterized protein n=1 Tax=Etheostoma spectabile TaxID=54343 RepID=A0A5J5DRC0_9PERO|nr:hypothetical protein FQN60_011123 [Etheostoma spectabile]